MKSPVQLFIYQLNAHNCNYIIYLLGQVLLPCPGVWQMLHVGVRLLLPSSELVSAFLPLVLALFRSVEAGAEVDDVEMKVLGQKV